MALLGRAVVAVAVSVPAAIGAVVQVAVPDQVVASARAASAAEPVVAAQLVVPGAAVSLTIWMRISRSDRLEPICI